MYCIGGAAILNREGIAAIKYPASIAHIKRMTNKSLSARAPIHYVFNAHPGGSARGEINPRQKVED